jgi:hypothetical protein
MQIISLLMVVTVVKEMLLAGHNITEPYLATLLCRFQNTTRKKLRDKLQIPVKACRRYYSVIPPVLMFLSRTPAICSE